MQWLFEVTHPAKTAANFAPALDHARIVDDEKAVINDLAGEKARGTGMPPQITIADIDGPEEIADQKVIAVGDIFLISL
jgi:hypothetical protein